MAMGEPVSPSTDMPQGGGGKADRQKNLPADATPAQKAKALALDMTNALKHGGPGVEVSAQFTHGPSTVEVRVLDNGRGGSATPSSSGLGLIGMKERADLCRGSLRSGPRPGGGFEVVAILPLRLTADS